MVIVQPLKCPESKLDVTRQRLRCWCTITQPWPAGAPIYLNLLHEREVFDDIVKWPDGARDSRR